MKKKIYLLAVLLCASLLLFPACGMDMQSSLKTITMPYIAEYECVEARLGNEDLLKKYEYFYITLLNKDELEVSFKEKDGKRSTFKGSYTIDPKTRELSGEVGVLGFKYKESVLVKNGQFVIEKNLGPFPLYMKFKVR